MAINNPVQTIQLQAIKNISMSNTRLSKAAINNRKPYLTVIDTIRGLKTRAEADANRTIISSMGTGFNIINTAMATLKNIRSQLEQVKQTVATLNGADDATIEIADRDYNTIIGQIFDTLDSTNLLGINLFDGTLANAPTVRLPSQNLPLDANPFKIPMDANTIDTLDIAIPRLLPGDGSLANNPVNGTYTQLFPVTKIAEAVLSKVDGIAIIPKATNIDTTGGTGYWDGTNLSGSYGAQLAIIDAALPSGISAEEDIIRKVVMDTFLGVAKSYETPESRSSAKKAMNYAKAVAKAISLSKYNKDDLANAKAEIVKVIATIPGGEDRDISRNRLVAIPDDDTVTQSLRALKAAAIALFDANGPTDGKKAAAPISGFLDTIIKVAIARDVINPVYIGSVKTPAGRIGVTQTMNNAIGTLDTLISNLTGTGNSLTSARSATKALIVELDTAANKYTAANYNEIVSLLSQSSRALTTLFLCFAIQERIINSNVSSLTRLADTIPA